MDKPKVMRVHSDSIRKQLELPGSILQDYLHEMTCIIPSKHRNDFVSDITETSCEWFDMLAKMIDELELPSYIDKDDERRVRAFQQGILTHFATNLFLSVANAFEKVEGEELY